MALLAVEQWEDQYRVIWIIDLYQTTVYLNHICNYKDLQLEYIRQNPHMFSPRFVTQIFVAGKKLFRWSIMCLHPLVLVYHWLSTLNCKAVAISGYLLPRHDCHLDVQRNTITAWAIIHSGFPATPNQWKRERLNSEKCLEQPWLLEPPKSGNFSHKPWSVMLSCIGVLL